MGMEVSSEQALSAANDLVKDVSDFGDAVNAEVRHHTGGLMAGHQRSRHVVLARDAAQVAAAHAGRHDLHPDLAWPDCGSVLDVLGQADVFFAVPLLDESQHPLAAPASS